MEYINKIRPYWMSFDIIRMTSFYVKNHKIFNETIMPLPKDNYSNTWALANITSTIQTLNITTTLGNIYNGYITYGNISNR